MVKVITYGTYDMLHFGHIRLLERAKMLGDYLIVGVTSDDYDKSRGKINNQQSLRERIAAIEATGIPDEVIIEEYEGQKIEDIKRFGVHIFAIGSDWEGKFDYLREYCKVEYLSRTEGVSSSEIRSEIRKIGISVLGATAIRNKFIREAAFVNGVQITEQEKANATYIVSPPYMHFQQTYDELLKGKHVLCEAPLALSQEECKQLYELADKQKCVLMAGIKTAYSTAYSRLVLLAKAGKIGKIVSVDATCTSMRHMGNERENEWNSICAWGPTAMLPVFQILGTNYKQKQIYTHIKDFSSKFDAYTKVDFLYDDAVASIRVAKNAKSEGELIITGTKGYIYVPAPWWKTDYFEVRYENQEDNRRYFYQLDGEGIRYEIAQFAKSISEGKQNLFLSQTESEAMSKVIEDYYNGKDVNYF